MFQKAVLVGLGVVALALPAAAQADTFATYGDVQVVTPGDGANAAAYQLTSSNNPGPGWAGLVDKITSGLTVSQISKLSADYDMTTGPFVGGAPRFSLTDTTSNANNEAYVFWGALTGGGGSTNPNANGVWGNTGNYADSTSSDLRVFVNGFGGISQPNTGVTWAEFVTEAGSVAVGDISLDLDGGWANAPNGQRVLINDFAVNSQVFNPGVPEPTIWSMLLLGVGAIGASLRARSKQAVLA